MFLVKLAQGGIKVIRNFCRLLGDRLDQWLSERKVRRMFGN